MDVRKSEKKIYGTGVFYAAVTTRIIRYRWLCLLAVLLVTLFFGLQMPKLRFDNSSDIWFVEGHESLTSKARFDAAFGNDEFAVIMFTREETPFTPDNLKAMSSLADELENEVPYARKVTWLGNVEEIRGAGADGQEVLIEDFLAVIPTTTPEVDARLRKAIAEPAFVDNLVSRDGTVLTMAVEFDTYPPETEDSNPRYSVAEAINKILARPQYADLKAHVAGGPHFSYEYDALAKRETGKLFVAVLIVQAVLLFWFGRGPRGVAVPLVITSLAVFWTMGSIGLLGITMNLLTIALPTMLICVGIGDSMHGIAAFHDHVDRGLPRAEALRTAFAEVGTPIMLTSLTTAAGFLAYLATHVKPYREMGIYVAFGVFYAFVLSVILTPVLYSFGKPRPKRRAKRTEKNSGGDIFDRWLAMTHKIVMNHTRSVVVFFGLIMALTFVGYQMIKVESNTAKLVFKREPLRQTMDLVDERLGTTFSLEYLINTDKPSGIKNPAFMSKLDTLMSLAEEHPLVTKSVSVTDVLKKMRRALHGNDSAYYALPDSREALAQYLFLYESSGGDTLDRQVGFTYDLARLSLKTRSLDTGDARKLAVDIRGKVEELFKDEDVEIVESGGISRYLALNDILYEGQSRSFIAALAAITIVMIIVLRSFKLGFISMIPNIFPVFLTMGFMGLMGWYLDVITISFAAVIIGVAVDDTIHFFTRFRLEFSRCGRYETALGETLRSVGRPITFTSLVLIVGNAVFLMSSMLGFFKLGLLFGVAFFWALLADFYFAPALIVLLKPLGPERLQPGE
jgi:predicted RND superfamily exporter protein